MSFRHTTTADTEERLRKQSRREQEALAIWLTEKALSNLTKLKDCEAHATYIVDNGDKKTLKGLKINLTCESEYLLTDSFFE